MTVQGSLCAGCIWPLFGLVSRIRACRRSRSTERERIYVILERRSAVIRQMRQQPCGMRREERRGERCLDVLMDYCWSSLFWHHLRMFLPYGTLTHSLKNEFRALPRSSSRRQALSSTARQLHAVLRPVGGLFGTGMTGMPLLINEASVSFIPHLADPAGSWPRGSRGASQMAWR